MNSYAEFGGAARCHFSTICEKPMGGGGAHMCPPGRARVKAGSYMDICLPFREKEKAVAGMARTKEIFAEAKMNLHKTRMTGDMMPETSVLGLVWDTKTDELAVTVPKFPCPTTKSMQSIHWACRTRG